ncbi:MAG: arsenosugar biosynthesis radical SAM (seleno)protein ArsS [Planctomycetota bacterium]
MSRPLPSAARFDFEATLAAHGVELPRRPLRTLQVNVTRLCNQACRHCHVDAGPKRTEQMDRRGIERCLELLAAAPSLELLDVTGGAPELNPHFDELVRGARALGRRVMVRHNLTVTLDGNPRTKESKAYLPAFFAEQRVEVVSSLPYYEEYFTDKQRGRGVFEKSLAAMRLLNEQGYGRAGSGLELTLVMNPVGSYLPAGQAQLEADYRRALGQRHGVEFTRLIALTNMPINRFREDLERGGRYDAYLERLVDAFNPAAAENVMCRDLISVGWDGRLFDCDFNQMLELEVRDGEAPLTIFDLDLERLAALPIRFASHCFGCTAGAGSSCGGATA